MIKHDTKEVMLLRYSTPDRFVEVNQTIDINDSDNLRDLLYAVSDFFKALGYSEKIITKHIKPEVFDNDEEV